jgi:surface carbohydrate biosynthesis protein (TIGR04326 family)
MPQADLIALNGRLAVDAYLKLGYPKERIVECEALRYGYLSDIRARQMPSKIKEGKIRVLILGDYKASGTIKMLQLLEASVSYMPSPATYSMKPHPNYLVASADYPSLYLKVVMEPLDEIMHEYDVAYSSNMTSGAVDAYLAGLPVVVMLEEAELNFSPLRGQSGVHFVSTPQQLASALQTGGQRQVKFRDHNEFFFLDPVLSRWQRLLSSTWPA